MTISMFADPEFRQAWSDAQEKYENITLQDFILMFNGQAPEGHMPITKEEAKRQRKIDRRAAREESQMTNDFFERLIEAKKAANPMPVKRTGVHKFFKMNHAGEFYQNSEGRIVTNSLTSVSLC